jgi:uncharacterized protein YgbK (DUF1537 family)
MSFLECSDPARLDLALRRDPRRVVVLDDDPTGTQTISDVDIVLRPDVERFEAFFGSPARALYVLTNTRAMFRDEAIDVLREIVRDVQTVADRAEESWVPILRGDSTLRGHVFAEIDAIHPADAISLFVPAFPQGGRLTLGGVQLVEIDGQRWNAADTEFALDPSFGYRSRDLVSWVAEVGGGRSATIVPLQVLRAQGQDAVAAALEGAGSGSVVIPEAETVSDLRCVAMGLLDAEDRGGTIAIRSASTFAAIRAGLSGRELDRAPTRGPLRILVACGSYTQASTAQLAVLAARGWRIHELGANTSEGRVIATARADLDRDGLTILATPRIRTDDGGPASGASMMDRMTSVVRHLRDDIDGVIAKGGITSAAVATSLGADIARVEGQLAPGIALWSLVLAGRRRLPYAVIPGNVGGKDAIAGVLDRMR